MIQCHIQESSITYNLKFNIYFTLPELSAEKILTWNCHVDDSDKGICDIIIGRDILTDLGLNLKLSYPVIEADYEPFKGYMAPMVVLGTYEFKYLNTGNITPKYDFRHYYAEEMHESEQFRTYTKLLRVILHDRYEREYLNKVMKTNAKI